MARAALLFSLFSICASAEQLGLRKNRSHKSIVRRLNLDAHTDQHAVDIGQVKASAPKSISQHAVLQGEVSIAVVGSGPISETDRALIRDAKEVYRFNSMNNLRRDEPVGTVFLRRGGYLGDQLSGIPPTSGSCPLLKDAKGLLIIMDPGPAITQSRLQELRTKWPFVEVVSESPNEIQVIDGKGIQPNHAGFSSGFIGVSHVLRNSPLAKEGHKVHIFGMNWKSNSIHSGYHPWKLERQTLGNASSIVVHPSPAFFYKPRNSAGKMMWSCEGSYPVALASVSASLFEGKVRDLDAPSTVGISNLAAMDTNNDGFLAFEEVFAKVGEDGNLSDDTFKTGAVPR